MLSNQHIAGCMNFEKADDCHRKDQQVPSLPVQVMHALCRIFPIICASAALPWLIRYKTRLWRKGSFFKRYSAAYPYCVFIKQITGPWAAASGSSERRRVIKRSTCTGRRVFPSAKLKTAAVMARRSRFECHFASGPPFSKALLWPEWAKPPMQSENIGIPSRDPECTSPQSRSEKLQWPKPPAPGSPFPFSTASHQKSPA